MLGFRLCRIESFIMWEVMSCEYVEHMLPKANAILWNLAFYWY
jgi:hypothetical protein